MRKLVYAQCLANELTVVIPAFNEENSIVDTVKSVKNQTVRIKRIIVVDDHSTDQTGELAIQAGAEVLRPNSNTGSKAGAQNFALAGITTEYTMAIDADTILAPNAIEKLLPAIVDEKVGAACGFVVPRFTKTLWEKGRYVEYLFAFTFFKQVQDFYEKPLISSGCFSVYKTANLKINNGWSQRTVAEDMDLTWSLYKTGYIVRFVPEAVCYPIEPHDFTCMRKQLKRWSHGFMQNIKLHFHSVMSVPQLRWVVFVALIDATIASCAYIVVLPLCTILISPIFIIGYFIDLPAILVPIMFRAVPRRETWLAIFSLPSYLILRTVNGFMFLEALISELILNRRLNYYEKGH